MLINSTIRAEPILVQELHPISPFSPQVLFHVDAEADSYQKTGCYNVVCPRSPASQLATPARPHIAPNFGSRLASV